MTLQKEISFESEIDQNLAAHDWLRAEAHVPSIRAKALSTADFPGL